MSHYIVIQMTRRVWQIAFGCIDGKGTNSPVYGILERKYKSSAEARSDCERFNTEKNATV